MVKLYAGYQSFDGLSKQRNLLERATLGDDGSFPWREKVHFLEVQQAGKAVMNFQRLPPGSVATLVVLGRFRTSNGVVELQEGLNLGQGLATNFYRSKIFVRRLLEAFLDRAAAYLVHVVEENKSALSIVWSGRWWCRIIDAFDKGCAIEGIFDIAVDFSEVRRELFGPNSVSWPKYE